VIIARTLSILVPAILLTAQVQAQDERGSIDQIGAQDIGSVQQISGGARQVPAAVRAAPATGAAPPQLSSESESASPPAQLTAEPRNTRGPAQLYTGGRTAQPSEPLSRPSEGRTGAVTRVVGNDRCDPAAEASGRSTSACASVIESRAAEFARPDPAALSPEQRLLAEQRTREGGETTRDASRRLARSGEDTESDQAQAVASVVLGTSAASTSTNQASPTPTEGLSEATLTILNAIVAGAQNPQ
jgi:hypothetical protein